MADAVDYRTMRIPLQHGVGAIPAAGFGTLIADLELTRTATRAALDAGYRHLDCAEAGFGIALQRLDLRSFDHLSSLSLAGRVNDSLQDVVAPMAQAARRSPKVMDTMVDGDWPSPGPRW